MKRKNTLDNIAAPFMLMIGSEQMSVVAMSNEASDDKNIIKKRYTVRRFGKNGKVIGVRDIIVQAARDE